MISTISTGRHMHWYVNVENQAYGPYSDDQMRGFVAEGRITTASLISFAPENGFYPAGDFDEFNLWCGAGQYNFVQPLVASGGHAATQYTPIHPANPVATARLQNQPVRREPVHGESISSETMRREPNIGSVGQSSHDTIVFLIMAEIRSDGEMAFLQAVQSFGQTERIGDTVWLVRSPHSVEQIRNTLSQTLNQQDRLFILDSQAGKTAWFNIGADLDHRIRELWDEDEG